MEHPTAGRLRRLTGYRAVLSINNPDNLLSGCQPNPVISNKRVILPALLLILVSTRHIAKPVARYKRKQAMNNDGFTTRSK